MSKRLAFDSYSNNAGKSGLPPIKFLPLTENSPLDILSHVKYLPLSIKFSPDNSILSEISLPPPP